MAKKENIKQKDMADEFYDYWLSTHGFLKERTEPEIAGWALGINFTSINRESGRFDNQDTNILFHGTIAEIKDSIESDGLRATEGAACFTRRISHALNGFAVMGNYTMIGNGSVDKFIQDAVKKGIITGKDLKEQAKHAFEYWCQDKERENLGLITIWNPSKELIALDSKEKKTHKRHFAIYQPASGQSAIERRRELLNRKGGKIYLSPKYLRFIALPKKALIDKIVDLESAFAHGENIINPNRAKELKKILEEAAINKKYSCDKNLALAILVSICEAYLFDLVRANTESLAEGHIPHSRFPKLKNLKIDIPYIKEYQEKTIKKIDKYIKNKNLKTKIPRSVS
jgi:hypothetical protein